MNMPLFRVLFVLASSLLFVTGYAQNEFTRRPFVHTQWTYQDFVDQNISSVQEINWCRTAEEYFIDTSEQLLNYYCQDGGEYLMETFNKTGQLIKSVRTSKVSLNYSLIYKRFLFIEETITHTYDSSGLLIKTKTQHKETIMVKNYWFKTKSKPYKEKTTETHYSYERQKFRLKTFLATSRGPMLIFDLRYNQHDKPVELRSIALDGSVLAKTIYIYDSTGLILGVREYLKGQLHSQPNSSTQYYYTQERLDSVVKTAPKVTIKEYFNKDEGLIKMSWEYQDPSYDNYYYFGNKLWNQVIVYPETMQVEEHYQYDSTGTIEQSKIIYNGLDLNPYQFITTTLN